jgi:hypothetical protein
MSNIEERLRKLAAERILVLSNKPTTIKATASTKEKVPNRIKFSVLALL